MNQRQTKVFMGVERPGSGNVSDAERNVRSHISDDEGDYE